MNLNINLHFHLPAEEHTAISHALPIGLLAGMFAGMDKPGIDQPRDVAPAADTAPATETAAAQQSLTSEIVLRTLRESTKSKRTEAGLREELKRAGYDTANLASCLQQLGGEYVGVTRGRQTGKTYYHAL